MSRFSNADIIKGASQLGISAPAYTQAVQSFNPDLYSGDKYAQLTNYVTQQYAGLGPKDALAAPDTGGGGGGPAAPAVNLNAYQQNPYLGQMADDITRRVNLSRDQGLNAIRGNAVGVGGLGGSRQGVAEGAAISGAADNLSGQLAGLYGGDYNNQMNRNLQQYGMDQNYNLGLGGLSNQRYGMDQNFYTQQRGQDQQGALLGASLYDKGTQGQYSPLTNANDIYKNYTGFGNSSTSSTSGGGLQGILGGALGGAQLAKNYGYFGNGGSYYTPID